MSLATRLSSATALAAVTLVAAATTASAAGADPYVNNPDNWEDGGTYVCTKVEYADGMKSFTRQSYVGFYVVKAGRDVTVVTPGNGYGDDYTSTKDISFIITCIPTTDPGGYPS